MRKGTFSAIALAILAVGAPLGAAGQTGAEAPHRVVSAVSLIGRVVHDDIGQPVARVRDVVFGRATGESLAVLEVRGPDPAVAPSHVVVPLSALRLPQDGALRMIAGVGPVAALPPIAVPPMAVARGLMVPPPDSGPLRVIAPAPQLADQPPR
ncbi:MAG: hypothetical protein WCZ23_17280 [Rhodospirillaceae bacterium]